jgi:hypothetical protein
LEKQHNFIFGLAVVCADKIQLRSKSAAMRLRSQGNLDLAKSLTTNGIILKLLSKIISPPGELASVPPIGAGLEIIFVVKLLRLFFKRALSKSSFQQLKNRRQLPAEKLHLPARSEFVDHHEKGEAFPPVTKS